MTDSCLECPFFIFERLTDQSENGGYICSNPEQTADRNIDGFHITENEFLESQVNVNSFSKKPIMEKVKIKALDEMPRRIEVVFMNDNCPGVDVINVFKDSEE